MISQQGLEQHKDESTSSAAVSVEATPRDEILLDEMRRRYDYMHGEIDTANTKAGLLLGYFATVLVVLVTSGASPSLQSVFGDGMALTCLFCWTACATLIAFAGGLFCCLLALLSRRVMHPMAIEAEEINSYRTLERHDAVLQLLSQYSEYTQQAARLVELKSMCVNGSLVLGVVFTLGGAGMLAISGVFY